MIVKSLLGKSLGASRYLSLLATASTPPWTQTPTTSPWTPTPTNPPWTPTLSTSPWTSTPTTLTQVRGGGFLAIPSNFLLKDHRHSIHSKILISYNNKNKNGLLDPTFPRNSLVCFSSDIKEKDLSKVKEDWEEEGVVCPHCKIGFTNDEALEVHIDLTGRGNGHAGCKVLWKKMNKEDVDAGKLPHVCKHDGCGIGFKTKSKLDTHKASHSDDRPYSCNQCGNSYKLQKNLNKHVREKHSEQVFECPECEKQFSSKGNMKKHLKTCRQEEKEFKCSQCGLKFHTNVNLTKHIKAVHNKEHPHKCELCDYTFSTKQVLKQHISAVHEKARPHQCEDCDAAFSTTRDLNKHRIRRHTFDWPHTCHVCEERGVKKGYIKPYLLKKHMEDKHPVEYQEQLEREKPAVCPHCEKRFKNEKQAKIHVKKMHN